LEVGGHQKPRRAHRSSAAQRGRHVTRWSSDSPFPLPVALPGAASGELHTPALIAIIGEAHRYPFPVYSGGASAFGGSAGGAPGMIVSPLSVRGGGKGLLDVISVVPEERWDVERWPLGDGEMPAR
jgi:hypothetical protein